MKNEGIVVNLSDTNKIKPSHTDMLKWDKLPPEAQEDYLFRELNKISFLFYNCATEDRWRFLTQKASI